MIFAKTQNVTKTRPSTAAFLTAVFSVAVGAAALYPAQAYAGDKTGKKVGKKKCDEGGKKHGQAECELPVLPDRISDYYLTILTEERLIGLAPEDDSVAGSPFIEVDDLGSSGGGFGSLYVKDNSEFWVSDGNAIGTADGFLFTGTNSLCLKGSNGPLAGFTATDDFGYVVGPLGATSVASFDVFPDCNGSAGSNLFIGNIAFADDIASGPSEIVIHGSDGFDGGIFKLNTTINTLQHIVDTNYGSTKLAFSKQGYLYVLNAGNSSCVKVISPSDLANPPQFISPQEFCLNLGPGTNGGATNISTGLNLANAQGTNGQTDLFLSANKTGGGSKIVAFSINSGDGSVNSTGIELLDTTRVIKDFAVIE